MSDSHDDLDDLDDPHGPDDRGSFDDVLGRVAGASLAITTRPGAAAVVRRALARRRRRRAVVGTVALVAAVAGVAGVLAVTAGAGDDGPEEPADHPSTPSAVSGGLYRPAGFFEDVAGGRAVPTITRHHVVRGVTFTARFDWTPPGSSVGPYLAAVSRELYRGPAADACADLLGGVATCKELADGSVIGRYEVPAGDSYLAPVHRAAPIRLATDDPTVRGATYFRADGLAISTLVCTCSADEGVVLSAVVPVDDEVLERVVTSPSWAKAAD